MGFPQIEWFYPDEKWNSRGIWDKTLWYLQRNILEVVEELKMITQILGICRRGQERKNGGERQIFEAKRKPKNSVDLPVNLKEYQKIS